MSHFMPNWRSNAFYLSRNPTFLMKGVAYILGFFVTVAIAAHLIFSSAEVNNTASMATALAEKTQESYNSLLRESKKSPDHLAEWLRDTAALRKHLHPTDRLSFDSAIIKIGGVNFNSLIQHHAIDPLQKEIFSNYARCIFDGSTVSQSNARNFLRENAGSKDSTRFANEFYADILAHENKQKEALYFYLLETIYPEASYARLMAGRIALNLKDITALNELTKNREFVIQCTSSMLLKIAKLLDDKSLLFRGLWTMQLNRISQFIGLSIAIFSAALWYVILITSANLRLRKSINYLPTIFAGMLSVWLLHTLQITLQYDVDPAFDAELSIGHKIFYWTMYVGLPEEVVKICLFMFFLPFLLKQRSAAKAALCGGCVGLGFALNENLQYYQDYGITIALGRLLTANIIHISLTGILGYELYLLFESRFHRAIEFILMFGAVILAHGLYDFCVVETSIEGLEIGSIIIVALAARSYLQRLHEQHGSATHQPVSRTSIFCLGSSLLVGVLILITVLDTNSLKGITLVLKEAISLTTVALIYLREFKEV